MTIYPVHCAQLAKVGQRDVRGHVLDLSQPACRSRANGAHLDILYFLKERTEFIRRHYDVCVEAFAEKKRRIEASEPPFDHPPCSENGEPAFLEDCLDADASVQLVGISCVSLLSDAIKLYLNLLQHRTLRFFFDGEEAKRLKKQFVATYRDALGEIFATDWSDTGINFSVIEQVMLARNRGQHGTRLTSFLPAHDDRTLAKHPVPFFISAEESQSLGERRVALGGFINPTIVISRDTLFAAIAEVEKLGEWIEANGERAHTWLEGRRAARRQDAVQDDDPADWPGLLPAFATHLAEAAERAATMLVDGARFQLPIEFSRLDDEGYRQSVLAQAKAWRNGSSRSTIYVFSYGEAVPQDLITTLRNAADSSLRGIDEARGFPKCNASNHSRCLYVGHSFRIETRLRDHLGFGAASTSSLHLRHWQGHPHENVTFTAYRLASDDKLLAQLLEEYLWDQLKPLLGKRGGK